MSVTHDLVGPEVVAKINVKGGYEEDHPGTVHEWKLGDSFVAIARKEVFNSLDGQER